MRIIYKKSINEMVNEEIRIAESRNRKIEKIIFTQEEVDILYRESFEWPMVGMGVYADHNIYGIPFSVE